MEKPPSEFDLKLMPDWLKDGPAKNPYADYEVREERPRRDFDRGPRDGGKGKPRDEKRGPGGPKRDQGRAFKKPFGDAPRPPREEAPRSFAPAPAPLRVEFLPEAIFVESVARQVKTTNRAYPLFELARMFLEKPERHRVRLVATEVSQPLHQLGEHGPAAFDAASLDRTAFNNLRTEFYTEEKTQREPLKGNFSNVARCRLTGTLLGPTNHHGYQTAVRKLYEERFSRRMPFGEFQREIEIVNDPTAVAAWKEEARNSTVYQTLKEAEPLTFATVEEAELHFRTTYLPGLVQTKTECTLAGEASRQLGDRRISAAIRQAWEKERGFPSQLMFHLRQQLGNTGLQFFKHRKRMQFVTVIRPAPFKDQSFSPNIAEILRLIESTPKCTRATLGGAILGAKEADPELPKLKASLASDLRWLIDAGRVIEFHDGRLELPLSPAEPPPAPAAKRPAELAAPTSPAGSSSESAGP